jgi:glycosyltransferase involved in cell wall biosynthesis
LTKVIYILPHNHGFSGRRTQVNTLIDNVFREDIQVDIVEFRSRSIFANFMILISLRHYSLIFVSGSRRFCLLLPLIRIFWNGKGLFYQSTSLGYDDPETVYNSWKFKILYRFYTRHIGQLPFATVCNRNAVSVPNFVRSFGSNKASEQYPQIGASTFVIVGAICERKGQLRALNELENLEEISYLKVIGPDKGFYEYDAVYIKKFKDFIRRKPNVEYMGNLTHEQLLNELADAGYFLCASTQEGASNAYLEAMSLGLIPVVLDDKSDTALFDRYGFRYLRIGQKNLNAECLMDLRTRNISIIENLNIRCETFYKEIFYE